MTHNLTGLLAQAYCTKENEHKIVDPTLLMAMDKIITDYLKGRAEWLLNQYNDHKEKDEIIREAFELPKEEKCEHQYPKSSIADDGSCVFCGKFPTPSQPEKEVEYGGICYICKGKNGKHVTHCSRIFSQPEKELPRKLNYIDKYPHPNHISLDVICSQKIDEIIDYLQSLRKEK